MKFEDLRRLAAEEPVFDMGFLYAGVNNPNLLHRQLSEWVRQGKVIRLRRGLYALAPHFQTKPLHPFVVANRLVEPSYVSLYAALAYYGLIPEAVFAVTSVAPARPRTYRTPLGTFFFRHLAPKRFFGYQWLEVAPGQFAWVARPEKALLDVLYLTPRSDTEGFLRELRLHLDALDRAYLEEAARRMASPKVERAVRRLQALVRKGEIS